MSHILNHNRTPFTFKLDRSEYWDFFLDDGPCYGAGSVSGVSDRCLAVDVDTARGMDVTDCLLSNPLYSWDKAINNGLVLSNIGLTGVDNGVITFDRLMVSNAEFIELFTNSEVSYEEYGTSMLFRKVDGNNGIFSYGNDIVVEDGVECARLNGGFYQGIFKSGDDYKLLPTNIGEGWGLEFVFKPDHSVKTDDFTLNDRHPENEGIFFYIGTRAENKWWKYYDVSDVFERISNTYFSDEYNTDSYFATISPNMEYFSGISGYVDYLDTVYGDEVCVEKPTIPNCVRKSCVKTGGCKKRKCNSYFTDGYKADENSPCSNPTYFSDEYRVAEGSPCDCSDAYNLTGDYADNCDVELNVDYIPVTKDGHSADQPNIVEIETDNKFLIFDRTPDGVTTETWEEGTTVVISDIKMPQKENYFLLYHRCNDGLTADKMWGERNNKSYDVNNDLYRNAFGLFADSDGCIGFKYLTKNCDCEDDTCTPYSIITEKTAPGTVTDGEWCTVHVKIEPIGAAYDSCTEKTSASRQQRITIYVNGKLKLISKPMPTFNFKKLNDTDDKQEAVPFNISLGGGTQGLCDVVYTDYTKLPDTVLTLEKEFGGSLNGYFRAFRFYTCPQTLTEIRANAAASTV